VYARAGFRVVRELAVELDEWAPEGREDGAAWGRYVVRYMRRPAGSEDEAETICSKCSMHAEKPVPLRTNCCNYVSTLSHELGSRSLYKSILRSTWSHIIKRLMKGSQDCQLLELPERDCYKHPSSKNETIPQWTSPPSNRTHEGESTKRIVKNRLESCTRNTTSPTRSHNIVQPTRSRKPKTR
jgi:hypothetical protein